MGLFSRFLTAEADPVTGTAAAATAAAVMAANMVIRVTISMAVTIMVIRSC